MTLRALDHYERRAVHDIRAWVDGDRGALEGLAATVESTAGRLSRPVEWAVDRALRDPRVQAATEGALLRAVEGIGDFMTAITPADGAAAAYGVADHRAIASLHLREVDQRLAPVRERHRALLIGMGAAEGVAGLAGTPVALAAFVASIPAMQAVSLRAVADISRHTGFDPADFTERQIIAEIALRTLEAGGRGQEEVLHRVIGLGRQVARRQAMDQLQQRAVVTLLRERANRAGIHLTRRRTAALLPVVGAVAGATFNAIHAQRLLGGATMLFRARHLARRHDLDLLDLLGPEHADRFGPARVR